MTFTDSQLDTLRHMLGINTPYDKEPQPYRNYAAVPPGAAEFAKLEGLGAVEKYASPSDAFPYDLYRCTEAGKLAAMKSHKEIRKTAGARRYRAYLGLSDLCPDLTFKEFLTSSEFADERNSD